MRKNARRLLRIISAITSVTGGRSGGGGIAISLNYSNAVNSMYYITLIV